MTAARLFSPLFFLLSIFIISTELKAQENTQDATNTSPIINDSLNLDKMLDKAEAIYFQGDYISSVKILEKADSLNKIAPERPDSISYKIAYWLGENYLATQKYDQAITYFTTSLDTLENSFGDKVFNIAKISTNLGYCYEYQGDYNTALAFKSKALKIYQEHSPKNDIRLGKAHNNVAASLHTLGEYRQSIRNLRTAEEIFLVNDTSQHGALASIYLNIGLALIELGRINEAFPAIEVSLKYSEDYFGLLSQEYSSAINTLGVCYEQKGDFNKALAYKSESLRIRKEKMGERNVYVAFSYNNVGTAYYYMGAYDEAAQYYQKALDLLIENLGEEHYYVGMVYPGLGITYLANKNYPKAVESFNKSLSCLINSVGVEHPGTALAYHNLGFGYQHMRQFDRSGIYLDSALMLRKKLLGATHPQVALSMTNLAINCRETGQYNRSDSLFSEALQMLNYRDLEHIDMVKDYTGLFLIFFERSELSLKRYQLSRQPSYLKQSYRDLNRCLGLVKKIGKETSDRNFEEFAAHIPQLSIKALKIINAPDTDRPLVDKCFDIIQTSKSLLLFKTMQESNALHFANLPDSLLQKEYDLRTDITFYSKKRQAQLSEGREKTDTAILALGTTLFQLRQEHDQLKRTFEDRFPEYYELKYKPGSSSLKEIQQDLLEEEQALLEYFIGDSSIFVLRVEKENYQIYELQKDSLLEEKIQIFRNNISQPHNYTHARYASVSNELYNQLFQPVSEGLPERIIIIPDGILGNLPFEALLTASDKNIYEAHSLPYLIHDHQISYCYSATLLREMKQKKHRTTPSRTMLSFAPFTDADTIILSTYQNDGLSLNLRSDTLTNLPYSKIELDSLSAMLSADAYYGKNATKAKLLEIAGEYRVVHLSTHGKADASSGDYSYLVFSSELEDKKQELLYVRDLYNLSLNADLVTLSACETGTGELQRGEGIISLARAFAYAGAKSIATTLWQVNDQSTQKLMVDFYRYLQKGWSKDRALRQAKLDYLKKHQGSDAYPFQWSPIIGVGDMSPLFVK